MSFGGGRVNVSQYLRNLNVQEPAAEETLITDEDLALFTNTQFYDFETGQHTDYQAPPVKSEVTQPPTEDVTPTDPILTDFPANFDFIPGDFNFGDFSSPYTSPTVPTFPDGNLGNPLQPIQPSPQAAAYPSAAHSHLPGYVQPGTSRGGGEKRQAEAAPPPPARVLGLEEASRLAAEEDKRKRNTAASARFRIKKKQREQALEKSAKEMSEKVTVLEGRISALETENRWLKSLVTEKHGGRDDIVEKLLREFSARKVGKDGAEAGDSIKAASDSSSPSVDGADKSSKKKD